MSLESFDYTSQDKHFYVGFQIPDVSGDRSGEAGAEGERD